MSEVRIPSVLPLRMNRAEYRAWAAEQPRGRFERIDGEVVAMSPERLRHVQVKAFVWLALARAIHARGLDCKAFADGATVEVGEETDYEPDALVHCGPFDPESVAVSNPLIVVEILMPGSRSADTGAKLTGYFRVPTIQHYLIVGTRRQEVIHHRRAGERIETAIATGGSIALEPPGLTLAIADFYRDPLLG
jgi:Uma2 family endonuclease